jgi:hypothetical protein
MTFLKPFAFFFLLSVFSVGTICQDLRPALLVDEFGRTGCEDRLARTASFAQTLSNEHSRVGLVVVYGSDINAEIADLVAASIHRDLLGWLGFDSKVTIIRSHFEKALEVQFWMADDPSNVKVPQGKIIATIPFVIDKRFYFGAMSGDPCTNQISLAFAKVLKSDQRYTGQIVNFNVPRREHTETAAEQIREFSRKYDLPRSKLRIFFKQKRDVDDPIWSNRIEFWIIPSS